MRDVVYTRALFILIGFITSAVVAVNPSCKPQRRYCGAQLKPYGFNAVNHESLYECSANGTIARFVEHCGFICLHDSKPYCIGCIPHFYYCGYNIPTQVHNGSAYERNALYRCIPAVDGSVSFQLYESCSHQCFSRLTHVSHCITNCTEDRIYTGDELDKLDGWNINNDDSDKQLVCVDGWHARYIAPCVSMDNCKNCGCEIANSTHRSCSVTNDDLCVDYEEDPYHAVKPIICAPEYESSKRARLSDICLLANCSRPCVPGKMYCGSHLESLGWTLPENQQWNFVYSCTDGSCADLVTMRDKYYNGTLPNCSHLTTIQESVVLRNPSTVTFSRDKIIAVAFSGFVLVTLACVAAVIAAYKKRTHSKCVAALQGRHGECSDNGNLFQSYIAANSGTATLLKFLGITEREPHNPQFEIPIRCLNFCESLDEGTFGTVYKGTLICQNGQRRTVAVKKAKKDMDNSLITELNAMIRSGSHINVLGIYGAVTKFRDNGHICIVFPFCENGNLQRHLRRGAPAFICELITQKPTFQLDKNGYAYNNQLTNGNMASMMYKCEQISSWECNNPPFAIARRNLTTSDLLYYAYQVANGMEYIASRNVVHRDLATRNILLTESFLVKIADFGLSRHEDYVLMRNNEALPMRSLAIECFETGQFSSKSDVWSFGILLCEIFTLGDVPYCDKFPEQICQKELSQFLLNGNRLSCPSFAPATIYKLMIDCWNREPSNRPTFLECKAIVGHQLQKCAPLHFERLMSRLEEGSPVLSDHAENANSASPVRIRSHHEYGNVPTNDKQRAIYCATMDHNKSSLSTSNSLYGQDETTL